MSTTRGRPPSGPRGPTPAGVPSRVLTVTTQNVAIAANTCTNVPLTAPVTVAVGTPALIAHATGTLQSNLGGWVVDVPDPNNLQIRITNPTDAPINLGVQTWTLFIFD